MKADTEWPLLLMTIPTLNTQRLTLRPFTLDDAPVVQRLAGDREVASTTFNVPHPYEEGAAEAWIGTHAADWKARSMLVLAVTVQGDDLIGAISLHLSFPHRRAELGYWIGVPYWNRGYATEAGRALLDYGFDELGLNRIDAHYIMRNPASGRVMEKLGMKPEGTLRQHMMKWDVLEDVALYAVLASERP